MLKLLGVSLVVSLLACSPLLRAQDDSSVQPFSPEELDNLVASIALYPDPLLAQILPAASFPDQVDEAARFCRGGANPDDIDTQPWDVSVKAVAHYPTVLYMMADNLDWTTALGQAYVNQSEDVMASIQRLRQEAKNAGNLESTPQQDVEVEDGDVEIWPAQGQDFYVPVYDPGLVYFGSGGVFGGPVITFGGGFPIGVWLNYDFDWKHHRIYYHTWNSGRGWVARSRPYIHLNKIYVNDNLKDVRVNRSVLTRRVNYDNLTRYNSVHRDVSYGKTPVSGSNSVNNKIIQRNQDVNDTRLDAFRGRSGEEPAAGREEPNRAAAPPAERSVSPAFGGNRGSFDAKASSQRGQTSRASRPAPAPSRSSGGGGGGGGSHAGGGGGGGSHGGGGRH